MSPAEFAEECQRLARPRLDLRRHQTGEVAGVWGGCGPLPAPEGDWRHWITVSCDWLGRRGFPLSGLFGVYEKNDEEAFHEFTVVLADSAEVTGWGDGVLLAGTEEQSLPPTEALEMYGSPAMHELVQGAPAGTPFATYSDGCPLYRSRPEGILASLGGWHIPWPEYDAYDHEAGRLVLWTFKDAEPWLEVWQRTSGKLQAIPRIS